MQREARMFKALADEIRLRLLALLSGGELCVCELTEVLDLPQSTVSRHLAYLRNAGWVVDRRQGVWMYYRLAAFAEPLQSALAELLAQELPRRGSISADLERLQQVRRRSAGSGC